MHKRILTAALITAVGVIGFTAAAVVGDTSTPVPAHGILEPGGLAGVPGTDRVGQVVRDSHARDWGVTVFTSRNGQTCTARGRMVNGRVGSINPATGAFASYPIEDGASCIDLAVIPAGAQITTSDGVTTIHGVAGTKVEAVTLTIAGVRRDMPIGARGAFLAVVPSVAFDAVKVAATLKDGSVVSLFG